MFRFAVTPFLAFAFAMIPGLRVVGAAAISTDLDLSRSCAGCTPFLEDTIKADLDLSISIDKTTHGFSTCKYHDQPNCGNLDKILRSRARLHNLSVIISKLKFLIKKFWLNIKQSNTGVTNAAISKVPFVINAE